MVDNCFGGDMMVVYLLFCELFATYDASFILCVVSLYLELHY